MNRIKTNIKKLLKKGNDNPLLFAQRTQCVLGITLITPAIISVIPFTCIFISHCTKLDYWTAITHYAYNDPYSFSETTGVSVGMSASPIYIGLLAIAGAILLKNNLSSLFIKDKKKKNCTEEDTVGKNGK